MIESRIVDSVICASADYTEINLRLQTKQFEKVHLKTQAEHGGIVRALRLQLSESHKYVKNACDSSTSPVQIGWSIRA